MRTSARACAVIVALVSGSASASPPASEVGAAEATEPADETEPAEAAQPEPEPEAAAEPAPAEPEPEPEPEASWVDPSRAAQPEAPPAGPGIDPKNYKMVVAGNVLIGVGVGGFLAMVTGFLIASDARDRKSIANAKEAPDEDDVAKFDRRIEIGTAVGFAGLGAAVGLLATGITLTSLGKARERKRREALETGLAPVVGPGLAGLMWTGRF